MKSKRKWLYTVRISVAVLMLALLPLLLYVPSVQRMLLSAVTHRVTISTGIQLEYSDLRLRYPLRLCGHELYAHTISGDTIFYAGHLDLEMRVMPLLNRELHVSNMLLESATLHTGDLLEGMSLDAISDHIHLNKVNVSLPTEFILVDSLNMSSSFIAIRLDSLSPADTLPSESNWRASISSFALRDIGVDFRLVSDTLRMGVGVGDLVLDDCLSNFSSSCYAASKLQLSGSSLTFDLGEGIPAKGFDPSHIGLSNISFDIDSLFYSDTVINVDLKSFVAEERSGLHITSMGVHLLSDSVHLQLSDCHIKTPHSQLSATVELPWSMLDSASTESIRADIDISIGKFDIMSVVSDFTDDLRLFRLKKPLTLSCKLEGNRDHLYLRRLRSELPGVYSLSASGEAGDWTELSTCTGNIELHTTSLMRDSTGRRASLRIGNRFRVPPGIDLNLTAKANRGIYHAEASLTERTGVIKLSSDLDIHSESYDMALDITDLEPRYFLPRDSIHRLSASLRAVGKGFDMDSITTHTNISLTLKELLYKDISIEDISLAGTLMEHRLHGSLTSGYPFARGQLELDGELRRERTSLSLDMRMDSLDLRGLGLTDWLFSNAFRMRADIETDRRNRHILDASLDSWEMLLDEQRLHPKTVALHALTAPDTTLFSLRSGDLSMEMSSSKDISVLLDRVDVLTGAFARLWSSDSLFSVDPLTALLPSVSLSIRAGRDNPLHQYFSGESTEFRSFALDASTSPSEGVHLEGQLLSLLMDTTRIDTIRLRLSQHEGIAFSADVIKKPYRNQEAFSAGCYGEWRGSEADATLFFRNGLGETGWRIGLTAVRQLGGIDLHVHPEATIAFLPFVSNADNRIFIKSAREIFANLFMTGAADGASIRLYSTESDREMSELSFELNRMTLDNASRGIIGLPIGGMADVSVRYVPTRRTYMLVADASVDDLTYEGGRIGKVLVNGVYLPLPQGDHLVDMHLFHNDRDVLTFSARYQPDQGDHLAGTLNISRLPLSAANPVISGGSIGGWLEGAMRVSGTSSNPLLDGYLRLEAATAYIGAAGANLRFDSARVLIKDNRLSFNRYNIYAAGKQPLVINGSVTPSEANLSLTSTNFQLLDSRQTSESIVYGKIFSDFRGTLKGPLTALEMRGNLHLSGSTNMTYVMKEDPLAVNDRMTGLVTFARFSDTIPGRRRRSRLSSVPRVAASPEGVDVSLTIRIDPAVKLKIDLDEDDANRVELEGGGDLSFRYTRQGDMLLNGRYTLSDGLVKYNMPVISNKTLKMKENSFIEWTGDPFNPYLSLTAVERIRAMAGASGQTPHMVNFDAGIEVRESFSSMSVGFSLEAIDDGTIQNQLVVMGAEERSKQAVSLLLTGMYLTDDGSGLKTLDMGKGMAINSFLQKEIEHITGSLLKGVDFNFNIRDNATDDISRRTDYAFRFSKRFYNERLNVILGGLISTGDNQERSSTFINDASLEYRLDENGNRYAKLFYNRQYESLLEGELTKYGAGIVFRKKMSKLGDLFIFRRKRIVPVREGGVRRGDGGAGSGNREGGER